MENKNGSENGRSFLIKSGGVNRTVALTDVTYAEVLEHRIILHMKDRKQIEYYGKMSDLEKVAGDDFFRVHRAYLINLGLLSSYNSKTVTICEAELPIARGKYNELVKAYLAYVTREERM